MITITQGDSLGQDITCKDFGPTDTFEADTWSGVWAIVTTIGAAPTIQESLVKSSDFKKMLVRVTPTQTNTLVPGKYYLVTRVNNTATEFSEQIQKTELRVEKKGI